MQWMFAAMQIFMAKETIAKMQWMSYGTELHKYLGPSVPAAYGGSGSDLTSSSITPKYDGVAAGSSSTATATPAPTATTTEAPVEGTVPAPAFSSVAGNDGVADPPAPAPSTAPEITKS